MKIIRNRQLANKIIFVDGYPGCGKTLLSNLVSTLSRVELLTYSYEIEHLIALNYLQKIDEETVISLVRLYADLKLYNTMMGRDVNFRFDDLSSAFKYSDSSKYFKRLFQAGDDAILENIASENPILNIATHNLYSYSLPIQKAFKDKCLFVQLNRHPLYMIKQQKLNMERLLEDNPKYFTINFAYKNNTVPYYVKGWEESFISSNSVERSIYFLYSESKRKDEFQSKMNDSSKNCYLSISFESLATNPVLNLQKIADILDTELTDKTYQAMKIQNVPRDMVSQGVDIEIYRKCGWRPLEGRNEYENLLELKNEITPCIRDDAYMKLEYLIDIYERTVWSPIKGIIE